jgi:hypothetical protein
MAEALLTIGLDYADFDREDAEMVALLSRALALLPPGDSPIRATAVSMIDRLVHHAEILSLKGHSHRHRDKDLGSQTPRD